MFQVRCCIQCKATTNVKGNHLLDCEHMWDGKRLRKGVEAHAIHRKCIPNWQELSKDPKWWCKQLFCLSLRSTYDKRQVQSFPTYPDDMKSAFFQGRTYKQGPYMVDVTTRTGFPVLLAKKYKIGKDERFGPCCFESSMCPCEHNVYTPNAISAMIEDGQNWWGNIKLTNLKDVLIKTAAKPAKKTDVDVEDQGAKWLISGEKIRKAKELKAWKASIMEFLEIKGKKPMPSCLTIVDEHLEKEAMSIESESQYNSLCRSSKQNLFSGLSAALHDCDAEGQAAVRGIAGYLKNPDDYLLAAVRLRTYPAGFVGEVHEGKTSQNTQFPNSTELVLEGTAILNVRKGKRTEGHAMFFGEAREKCINANDEIVLKTVDLKDEQNSLNVDRYTCVRFSATFFKHERKSSGSSSSNTTISTEISVSSIINPIDALLTPEDEQVQQDFLTDCANGSPDDVVIVFSGPANIDLKRKVMLRLKREYNNRPRKATTDSWLDDDIVNYWFGLIEERSVRKMVSNSVPVAEKLKVRVLNSQYFWVEDSHGPNFDKFLCKIPDIFDQDKVIIPVYMSLHWTILVVNFSKNRFEYYDTLGANTVQAGKAIATAKKGFLRYADSIQKGTSLSSYAQYIPTIQQIPQQENGDDCGVFVCTLADYLAQDLVFNFTQDHIPRFRLKMVRDLRQRRLD